MQRQGRGRDRAERVGRVPRAAAWGVSLLDPRARARRLLRPRSGEAQWLQAEGAPADSAVRKLEPQPQPPTEFGFSTVKPAPISEST